MHKEKLSALKRAHKQEISKIQEAVTELKDGNEEYKESSTSINKLEDEKKILQTKVDSLSEELDRLQIDYNNLKETPDLSVKDSETSKTKTENGLDDQVKLLQNQVQQYQNDIEQFEYLKADWQLEKEALEDVLMNLRSQLKQAESSLVVIQAQQGLEEVAKHGETSLKDEISKESDDDTATNLANQINELVNGNQQLEEERDQLLAKVETLEEKLLVLEKQTTGDEVYVNEVLQEKDNRLKSLIAEKEELETSLSELDIQHTEEQATLLNIKNNLAKKVEDLNKQLEDKDNIISQLETSTQVGEDFEIKIANLEENVEGLKKDLKQSEEKCQQQTDEIQDMKTKLQNGAVAVNDLHMDIRELETSLATKTEEVTDKVSSIKSLKGELKALTEEKENVEEKLEDAEEEIERLEALNEKTQIDQKSEFEKLKGEYENLNTKLQEAELINQKLQSEIHDLNKEIESLKNRPINQPVQEETFQKLSSSLEITSKGEESTCDLSDMDNLKSKNLELTNDIQVKDTVISHLKEEVETSRNKMKELDSYLTQMKTQVEQTTLKLQEKETQLKDLQMTLNQLQSEDFKKEEEKNRLEAEVNKFKESTESLAEQLAAAENKTTDNMSSELSHLQTQLQQSHKEIQQLKDLKQEHESVIADHEKGIKLLNLKTEEYRNALETEKSKQEYQENVIALLKQNTTQKEENLQKVHRKLKRATSFLNDDQKASVEMDNDPDLSLPALEYHKNENGKTVEDSEEFDEEKELNTDQIEYINRELEQLQGVIGEKDQIISDLQQKNLSLLKVLETKSLKTPVGDKSVVDVHRLENEVKKLMTEKEQIMAVMNEKSRESSNLKTEVHRLMNIVAAERTALNKLQKDNHDLLQKRENPNDDMQKAALQQLSRIIRDKDVEIEALKQKNDTLVAVLQDSSQENNENHLSKLLSEKEDLSKQVATLQAQNEQLVVFLNQKHQEAVTYHNEVQRLSTIISEESQKSENANEEYAKIVPQFEEKKQTLLKLQEELITYKQKFSELEVKYGEMVQKSNVTDTIDMSSFKAKEDELKRFQEKCQELQNNNQEKDHRIKSLNQQRSEVENDMVASEAEKNTLKKQVENLHFQIQGLNTEVGDLKNENYKLNHNQAQHVSEFFMLKETNNRLSLCLKEKDLEMNGMREKCETLKQLMKQDSLDQKDGVEVNQEQINQLVQQLDTTRQRMISLQQEKDQAIMNVSQLDQTNKQLYMEIERLKEKEIKLGKELDRLRTHLIQIEEGYTREALDAEEREKELRNRLVVAEEKLMSTSSNVQAASHQLNVHIEELKYQLQVVSSQRDAAYSQVTSMQDQCSQYASSLANLQNVLEQFQQDKDSQIASESERYEVELKSLKEQYVSVQHTLSETQVQLEEASEGLEAAARLSQQLDRKEEAIQALRDEVQLREESLNKAEEEIKKLSSSTEAKVDKELMKNLLLGYFTTPQKKRKEVVHTIGGVLNFNPEEFHKIAEAENSGGWVPGFFKLGRSNVPTPPVTPVKTSSAGFNQSFSQLFVKFLENESSPPPPPVRLPAEKMVEELHQKHKEKETVKQPAFNPFTAPRHVAMPITLDGNRSSPSEGHILMAPINTPSYTPMFTTPTASENVSQPNSGRSTPNSSSAILKNVLGSR